MNEYAFVSFIVDRFDLRRIRLLLQTSSETLVEVQLSDVGRFPGTLVTYQANLLVDALRAAQLELPVALVEIGDALKLRSQIARDQGGQRHWDFWKAGQKYSSQAKDAKRLARIFDSREAMPSEAECEQLLRSAMSMLRGLWAELLISLRDQSELQRFLEIEVPVQQIFFRRQLLGIAIDNERLKEYLNLVEHEKYSKFATLSATLGFAPIGIQTIALLEHLENTDAAHLVEVSNRQSVEDCLVMAQDCSMTANDILSYVRAKRDHSVLLQLLSAEGRVFPFYHCHGTVTCRILVSEPRIQELRRKYRGVIAASEGKNLLYFDYGQFEPGILASLANDDALIDAYNSSDLYIQLSLNVYGDSTHRDVAKKIFLAYCYGMTTLSIAKLIAGANSSEAQIEKAANLVSAFFQKFSKIEELRTAAQQQLFQMSKVSSGFGNFRRRLSIGPLSSKEKRWALNHTIQATASLIFKRALIGIAEKFGRDCIVLPMHDAVLLEWGDNADGLAIFRAAVVEIMSAEFTKACPRIAAKVTVERFDPS